MGTLAGVMLGLGAALFQALSYLYSRWFVAKHHHNVIVLLTLSHVLMGGISVVGLCLILPDNMSGWKVYFGPVAGCSLFYIAGQAALFMALRRSDASRVSPLLGLKLVVLAGITTGWLSQTYSLMQWVAVLLTVVAAWVMNQAGGRLSRQSVIWILGACAGYSLSDLHIRILVDRFAAFGLLRAAVLSALLCYVFCGVCCLPSLFLMRKLNREMWMRAVPFAALWLISMLLLFACFGVIGVVFGNIVQATRGLISIVLGSMVAMAGFEDLESRITTTVLLRRIGAALMMLSAIALFYIGK